MRAKEIFETQKVNSPEFNALLTPAVVQLDKVFSENGFEIRIVGGAVRDLILGKAPKDIDMATTATPEQSMDLLISIGVRVEPTGLQHGTITAIIDGEPIEITTLRIDTNQDGRHADVEFTTDGGCLNPELLSKFIDMGYDLDQDYSFEELLKVARQINQ